MSTKWRQLFVKNSYTKSVYLSKSSKFRLVWTIRFCSNFASIWYKHFFKGMYGKDFRLPMSALATVARRVLMENLLQKLISDRAFYATIADVDIGSLKSLHTLFDKYLNHMLVKFEQNRTYGLNHTKFCAF